MNKVDQEYFRLLRTILQDGREKKNRTGVDTIGVFGEMAKFEVKMDAFPILTTKRVWFKGIVHELLWFIKGDTNIKYLVDNDVHIWDEWAYAKYKKSLAPMEYGPDGMTVPTVPGFTQDQFIQLIKEDPEFARQNGELGEGTYGGMWRAFPYFTFPPETPSMKGFYAFYVPDLSYDAFELKNNKWTLKDDIIGVNDESTDKITVSVYDEKTGEVVEKQMKSKWIDPSDENSPAGGNKHIATTPEQEDGINTELTKKEKKAPKDKKKNPESYNPTNKKKRN
jgi:hypothetical protein